MSDLVKKDLALATAKIDATFCASAKRETRSVTIAEARNSAIAATEFCVNKIYGLVEQTNKGFADLSKKIDNCFLKNEAALLEQKINAEIEKGVSSLKKIEKEVKEQKKELDAHKKKFDDWFNQHWLTSGNAMAPATITVCPQIVRSQPANISSSQGTKSVLMVHQLEKNSGDKYLQDYSITSELSFSEWSKNFEDIITASGEADVGKQLALLRLKLNGWAKQRFDDLVAAEKTDLQTALQNLTTKLDTTESQHIAMARLKSFPPMVQGQSIMKYAETLEKLVMKAMIKDAASVKAARLMEEFLDRLPFNVSFYVKDKSPTSFQEALGHARKYEALWNVPTSQSALGANAILSSEIDALKNQMQNIQKETLQRDGKINFNDREMYQKNVKCFACNKMGHYASGCRSKRMESGGQQNYGSRDAQNNFFQYMEERMEARFNDLARALTEKKQGINALLIQPREDKKIDGAANAGTSSNILAEQQARDAVPEKPDSKVSSIHSSKTVNLPVSNKSFIPFTVMLIVSALICNASAKPFEQKNVQNQNLQNFGIIEILSGSTTDFWNYDENTMWLMLALGGLMALLFSLCFNKRIGNSFSPRTVKLPASNKNSALLFVTIFALLAINVSASPMICQKNVPSTLLALPEKLPCGKTFPLVSDPKKVKLTIYQPNVGLHETKAFYCRKIEEKIAYRTSIEGVKHQKPTFIEKRIEIEECKRMISKKSCSLGELRQKKGYFATDFTPELNFGWPVFSSFWDRHAEVENCFLAETIIFTKNKSTNMTSPAGDLSDCNYKAGQCHLPDNSVIMWEPKVLFSCGMNLFDDMDGFVNEHTAGWVSKNGEFALTFNDPKYFKDCNTNLVRSDQGYGIREKQFEKLLSAKRSKRETSATGVVTTNQLAAQLQAMVEAAQRMLTERFAHLHADDCASFQAIWSSFRTTVILSPSMSVRGLLQREDIQAQILAKNLVEIFPCTILEDDQWEIRPSEECVEEQPIWLKLGKQKRKAYFDTITNIATEVPTTISCDAVMPHYLQLNSSFIKVDRISGKYESVEAHHWTPATSSKGQTVGLPHKTQIFHNLLMTKLEDFLPINSIEAGLKESQITAAIQNQLQRTSLKTQVFEEDGTLKVLSSGWFAFLWNWSIYDSITLISNLVVWGLIFRRFCLPLLFLIFVDKKVFNLLASRTVNLSATNNNSHLASATKMSLLSSSNPNSLPPVIVNSNTETNNTVERINDILEIRSKIFNTQLEPRARNSWPPTICANLNDMDSWAPVCEGLINHNPAKILFDSGSAISFCNSSKIEKLGFAISETQATGRKVATIMGEAIPIMGKSIAILELGTVITVIEIWITDVPLPNNFDILLGVDTLKKLPPLRIDFINHHILLDTEELITINDNDNSVLMIQESENEPVSCTVTINGQFLKALIDTGACVQSFKKCKSILLSMEDENVNRADIGELIEELEDLGCETLLYLDDLILSPRVANPNIFWQILEIMLKKCSRLGFAARDCQQHKYMNQTRKLINLVDPLMNQVIEESGDSNKNIYPTSTKPSRLLYIDFFGSIKNVYWLIVIDACTKRPFVTKMESIKGSAILKALQSVLDKFLYCTAIASDNGPPCMFSEFKNFLQSRNIRHLVLPNPASNGLTKRFIETTKLAVKKILAESPNDSPELAVQQFLEDDQTTSESDIQEGEESLPQKRVVKRTRRYSPT